jgi:hypothetical protein
MSDEPGQAVMQGLPVFTGLTPGTIHRDNNVAHLLDRQLGKGRVCPIGKGKREDIGGSGFVPIALVEPGDFGIINKTNTQTDAVGDPTGAKKGGKTTMQKLPVDVKILTMGMEGEINRHGEYGLGDGIKNAVKG